MMLLALGRAFSPFLRVLLIFPRTFLMTRYAYVLLTHGIMTYRGTARMVMVQRKLDEEFGCADARVALPAADGTDRRAGDWRRRSH